MIFYYGVVYNRARGWKNARLVPQFKSGIVIISRLKFSKKPKFSCRCFLKDDCSAPASVTVWKIHVYSAFYTQSVVCILY